MAVSYPIERDHRVSTPEETEEIEEIDALAREWRESTQSRLCATAASANIYALDHYLRYLEERDLESEAMSLDDITTYAEHCRARCRRALRPHRRASLPATLPADEPSQRVPCFSMLNTRLHTLRSFYDLLVERNVCASNPLRGGVSIDRMARGEPVIQKPQPKPQRIPLTSDPSPEEIAALAGALEQATARDQLLVALLLDTGLSIQTLCALPGDALTLRHQTLTLTPPGQRCLRCSSITARLYLCYMRECPPARHAAEPLLVLQSSDAATQRARTALVYHALRQIGLRAGAPRFGARELRHTHDRLAKTSASLTSETPAHHARPSDYHTDPLPRWNPPATALAQLLSQLFPTLADE